jgi:ZIP family zinc transporter
VLLLVAAHRFLHGRDVHVGRLRGSGVRLSVLVFGVLLVHSLPEGLAIGTAYASELAGLSLFVILAIGLQNIPEGTSVAIPMEEAGFSRSSQFWAAVLTSAPQPVGAVFAYLIVEHVQALLPASFAFAAGAMLALVFVDLVPQAFGHRRWLRAGVGSAAGAAAMLVLAAIAGV